MKRDMQREPLPAAEFPEGRGSLLVLALLAPLVGAASGLIGALFRLALTAADHWRDELIARAHGDVVVSILGFILVAAVCAAAVALAAWLVRRFAPHASGSGIPHVEAVLRGELPHAPYRLLGVKFTGGVLAIGAGLALGREGPSVQMGANLGHMIGTAFRRDWPDCRVLLAAGAGAGLATAFNAPIAGAVFVLEELVRRFEPRIAIAALGSSAAAIAVARVLIGDLPDFTVAPLAVPPAAALPLHVALGAIAGLAAVAYNRSLLATIALADRFTRMPIELRAAAIGAAVGMLAWLAPDLVGGGDLITQRTLAGAQGLAFIPLAFIPLAFLVRLLLGAVSYAAGTPGGLFAPLLVLGAQLGLFVGLVSRLAFPGLGLEPTGFAVVGMAALFTGVVRAPLTGIVLVTEMTANVTLLLQMLAACCVAMLVPTLMRDPPIYDSLRELTLRHDKS
jgi:chloride channel protein, CIC family